MHLEYPGGVLFATAIIVDIWLHVCSNLYHLNLAIYTILLDINESFCCTAMCTTVNWNETETKEPKNSSNLLLFQALKHIYSHVEKFANANLKQFQSVLTNQKSVSCYCRFLGSVVIRHYEWIYVIGEGGDYPPTLLLHSYILTMTTMNNISVAHIPWSTWTKKASCSSVFVSKTHRPSYVAVADWTTSSYRSPTCWRPATPSNNTSAHSPCSSGDPVTCPSHLLTIVDVIHDGKSVPPRSTTCSING